MAPLQCIIGNIAYFIKYYICFEAGRKLSCLPTWLILFIHPHSSILMRKAAVAPHRMTFRISSEKRSMRVTRWLTITKMSTNDLFYPQSSKDEEPPI
jgi:hypothetical protein